MQLKNKVVLVTGGAVRVGRAITLEMLASGAKVFCHYFSSDKEASELRKDYSDIYLIKSDLRNIDTIESIIDQILKKAGTIDVLINNAAIFIKTPFGSITEDNWEKLFSLNLKAAFFLAQTAGKRMVEKGRGKIINIADSGGVRPWPSFIPYSLTKSAMITLTKGLAKALAPSVQVNCINPGPVMLPDYYTEEERMQAIDRTLLKREGRAEDIANAVRFLLEDGDYITGIALSVDGGRNIT